MPANNKLLNQHLRKWIQRYRLQRGLRWTWRGLLLGGSGGLAAGYVLMLQGRIIGSELLSAVIGCSLLVSIASGTLAYAWHIPDKGAARHFDRQLNLKERVSTALEFSDRRVSQASEIIRRQYRNTLEAVTQVDIRKEISLDIPRRELSMIIPLLLLVAGTLFFGTPSFEQADNARSVQTAIEEEIARIEEIQQDIKSDPLLTAADQNVLTEPLDAALQQLQEAQSLEEALSALNQAEQNLQGLSDPNLQAQLQGLQQVGEQLAQGSSRAPLNEFVEDLAKSDLDEAAQSLTEIDPSTLTPPDLDTLSSQLSQAAQALAESNPELSSQLAEAAGALQNGDLEAMREALADAALTLQAAAQEAALANAAGEAADQLGAGLAAIAEENGIAELLSQTGQTGNSGQGAGASGAGNQEFTEPIPPGSEVGLTPIDQNNQAGDGGETVYEPIYAPEHLGGEDSMGGNLPQGNAEGDSLGSISSNPTDPNELSSVPYVQVLAEYDDVYRTALENDEVPLEWRSVVREYFSSLQP